MPARWVFLMVSWSRFSTTMFSMPDLASRWESIRPAGPPPTMPTWVLMICVFAAMDESPLLDGNVVWIPFQCDCHYIASAPRFSLNGEGYAGWLPMVRAIPRAAVISAGTTDWKLSNPSGTTTPSAACALPCGPRTGTAMPVVSASTLPSKAA